MVFIDAINVKIRDGNVANRPVYIALGVTVDGTRDALTATSNDEFMQVSRWVRQNIRNPSHTRILVDDNLWLDMEALGFQPRNGVIWFNKLDLDPAVAASAPRGWRDIDYLVSTPGLRHALQEPSLPTVTDVVEHSRVVASFGVGSKVIEIREVIKEQP